MKKHRKIDHGVQTIQLDSWNQFYTLIADEFANAPAYVFRGQADAEWLVESSLDRLEKRFRTKPNFHGKIPEHFECPPISRDNHLFAFKQLSLGRRGSNPAVLDEDDYWALAQHHGLATPMLDWTRLPFIALFFAFEDELRVDQQGKLSPPEQRAVFAVSTSVIEEHANQTQNHPRLFAPKRETSYRLISQSGLFLKMPEGTDLESYVQNHFKEDTSSSLRSLPRPVLIKIIIKNDDRRNCLKMLNKMNINRMSLFPDLDGAARYTNSLWELDFDTCIGHIGFSQDK
jgi:hypothetical protein